MIYFCCDRLRRNALQGRPDLNGIDFLEVLDLDAPSQAERQRTLLVHFINDLSPGTLTEQNVLIEGGERVREVQVTDATIGTGDQAKVLTVKVDRPGDFSIYTLRLVQDTQHPQPPAGFDPLFSAIEFSFKVECPSDFDCQTVRLCPQEPLPSPEIDYLAKDYASFRRLMLDRMAASMPNWQERSPADLGVALVELLAYVGDYLSYQQDAIATEAYLGTARRRVSVRRHARLVDYFMHDGCNACAWVQVEINAGPVMLAKGTKLFSRIEGRPRRIAPNSSAYTEALNAHPVVFETVHEALLFPAHNQMRFYSFGDARCCLPKGATRAVLADDPTQRLRLRTGDVLIFEERLGPNTGLAADADPMRRHAVRLTRVQPEALPVIQDEKEVDRTPGALVTDPLTGQTIVEIEWDVEDALPFPLCLSTVTDRHHGEQVVEDVSVALGNIVLADHGLTTAGEALGKVPKPHLLLPPADDRCQPGDLLPVPPRFRPKLREKPLTQAVPYDPKAPASRAMRREDRDAQPAIYLQSKLKADTAVWLPKRDLLNSGADATEFVIEIEADGTAFLRFGDDQHGKRPEPETEFTAVYRVGNGAAGNLGAESLFHVVTDELAVLGVRNPLPAYGGLEPETIEEVRQKAPYAFRIQERAVTEGDYAEATERHPGVQRAAATFRWTGSWHTVFLTVDRLGGLAVDEPFESQIRRHVERYRLAGYDLEVEGPCFVPLEIEMQVCVKPDYFRSHVQAELLEVFSNRMLPDGRRGVFHPDNFSFGQTVFLSPLYAAAQAVPGVASVQITKFQRQGVPDQKPLEEGKLDLGRLEIARLDNDPNFPERGVFRLSLGGGK